MADIWLEPGGRPSAMADVKLEPGGRPSAMADVKKKAGGGVEGRGIAGGIAAGSRSNEGERAAHSARGPAAYVVMAYIVMAHMVMAYIEIAYIVMAYIVMAHNARGPAAMWP